MIVHIKNEVVGMLSIWIQKYYAFKWTVLNVFTTKNTHISDTMLQAIVVHVHIMINGWMLSVIQ